MILSWPDSEVFDILSGEPAMTIVPNLLASGILAIVVSLVFLVWVTVFVQRRYGGLVLVLLSLVMLLVGGGFGPPILGIILGLAATRMNAPLTWRRTHPSDGSRRFLAKLWPWSYVAAVIAWLLVLPGMVLLDYFFGVSETEFIVTVLSLCILSAFVLLLVTIFAGFARETQRQTNPYQAPSTGESRIT